MAESLWVMFCGKSDCSFGGRMDCNSNFKVTRVTYSCMNNAFTISVDILIILTFIIYIIYKLHLVRTIRIPSQPHSLSPLQKCSSTFNAGLGFIYFGFSVWTLRDIMKDEILSPMHLWLVPLFHGPAWLLLCLTLNLKGSIVSEAFVKIWSIFACLFATFLCVSSLSLAIMSREVSIKIVLDVLSLPGAVLLLLCSFRGRKNVETSPTMDNVDLYRPLNDEVNTGSSINMDDYSSPFGKAGWLSRMSFWWLNPLMKKGKAKTLDDEDIPRLCEAHRAETCYSAFMMKLNRQKMNKQSSPPPSILSTMISCHLKEILVSGFFALLKTLTLSVSPLLLNAFIEIAEGKVAFRYEGYVLVGGLFLAKCIESLSERQWYLRTRILGLQVRSLLSAIIYQKQLRLSNAAKMTHSAGEIMNYVTVDAYRIAEFPFWFHQTWTTILQLCIALMILFRAVGLATVPALVVIILTVLFNSPLAKLQNKYQARLMLAQDERVKATSEALVNMKVLKLYGWETHFKNVIQELRKREHKSLSLVQMQKGYYFFLYWLSAILVSGATFGTCYFLRVPLNASNVFTAIATFRLVQDPIKSIPDVIGVIIQAKVALARIVKFLDAPELQIRRNEGKIKDEKLNHHIIINSANLSWEGNTLEPTLKNINMKIKPREKVAICGEVGSGKSTLLAAILGEVRNIDGEIRVYGKIAYVSQTAWIQTGTIQENILFGSTMDEKRYHDALEKSALMKDLEMLPYGDLTGIGERGVNLSGGQKQRIQLARALYQNADIYLLDDPFSAVDAHTAKSLFNDYVMGALAEKTVLFVTHQVDFLHSFDSVMLISNGEILCAAPYHQLLASSQEFHDLVNANKEIVGSERMSEVNNLQKGKNSSKEMMKTYIAKQLEGSAEKQLIQNEERETGDIGLKPYVQYLNQKKGLLYFFVANVSMFLFLAAQILQNSWMAANVQDPTNSRLRLLVVYLFIGCSLTVFLALRFSSIVILGLESSESLFSQLLNSLFDAPMSFYDSTPLGRILSRVSSDLSIIDLDIPFSIAFAVGTTMSLFSYLGVLAFLTWPVLFVSIVMVYLTIWIQRYYFATAKELMRINGTTQSFVTNHLAESIAGAVTIRAFKKEEEFFTKNLDLINTTASPFFYNFAAKEWFILRLEMLCALVLFSSALAIVLLPPATFGPGFIGMALSYGLLLNVALVFSIQSQCGLANYIISVERLNQYMHILSEAPKVIETNRPKPSWPDVGKVEIQDLKIRYRPDTPLVLHGISCTFEGGHKVGVVGRTGSGKTTLISALFRLVEPVGGRIFIDGLDISTIGLHDLRLCLGIIPQDPTLFHGSVRYNLDPLSEHTDQEIWEVLGKCQLQDAVKDKKEGLDSPVAEDGSNWSMGQRQLFCLCRALLRRSRVLVLDEATASIDNSTDSIIQKTIRTEFKNSTVIIVAHRIPTVMDCTRVLSISDGNLVEYDEPLKLMKMENSLYGQLVKEYWSHNGNSSIHFTDT